MIETVVVVIYLAIGIFKALNVMGRPTLYQPLLATQNPLLFLILSSLFWPFLLSRRKISKLDIPYEGEGKAIPPKQEPANSAVPSPTKTTKPDFNQDGVEHAEYKPEVQEFFKGLFDGVTGPDWRQEMMAKILEQRRKNEPPDAEK